VAARRMTALCSLSSGVPCNSRGNHASGTDRLRPSLSSTQRVSAVTATALTTRPCSMTKVLMPRLDQLPVIIDHNPLNVQQLLPAKTPAASEPNGLNRGGVPCRSPLDQGLLSPARKG